MENSSKHCKNFKIVFNVIFEIKEIILNKYKNKKGGDLIMRKLDKILSIVLIVLMLSCFATQVFAAFGWDKLQNNKDLGQVDDTVGNVGSFVLTLVTNIAMVLSVVVIAILGVKYMMGSAEEKAEYKKTLIPYFIGALLVFGAGAIGKFVVNAGNTIAGTGTGTGA